MRIFENAFVALLATAFAVALNSAAAHRLSGRIAALEMRTMPPRFSRVPLTLDHNLAEAAGGSMRETSPYASNLRVNAKLSPEDFVPDGDLTKKVWQKAERIRFDHDWAGQKHFPEAETQVSCLWTPSSVYFAFLSKYATLNIYEGEDPRKERWELWNRDVAEIFINPHPEHLNHYYEFEVAPNNQWIDLEIKLDQESYDAHWDSHFEHATRIDTKNHLWTCEIRIPVAPMSVSELRPNTEWRINFYRADGPGDDTVRRFLAWSPTLGEKANFHVPTRFGIIRFVK